MKSSKETFTIYFYCDGNGLTRMQNVLTSVKVRKKCNQPTNKYALVLCHWQLNLALKLNEMVFCKCLELLHNLDESRELETAARMESEEECQGWCCFTRRRTGARVSHHFFDSFAKYSNGLYHTINKNNSTF